MGTLNIQKGRYSCRQKNKSLHKVHQGTLQDEVNPIMKILIENIKENPANALRKAGYHFERRHTDTKEISAARTLGAGGFPRLHAYARLDGKNLEISLHLDQKRPSYSGTSAHGGEYNGELLEQEAERIKYILR